MYSLTSFSWSNCLSSIRPSPALVRDGLSRWRVGVAQLAPELLVLAPRRAHEVGRAYDAPVRRGVEGGGERDVFDVAAGEAYGSRERAELHVIAERRFAGKDRPPDAMSVLLVRK